MPAPVFTCDFNGAAVIGDTTALGWDNPSQTAQGGTLALEAVVIPRVGTKSIKCTAPALVTSPVRAALQKAAFAFDAYTEAWIEWYVYVASAASYQMLGLLDIEDVDNPNNLKPGLSLYMTADRKLHCALVRCGANTVLDQGAAADTPVALRAAMDASMPVDQWVKMRAYIFFAPDITNGRVKVWRNDVLIMDGALVTMPLGGYVTDRIQLGVTNHEGAVQQVVYIADVNVWSADPGDGLSPGGSGHRKDEPIPDAS